MVGWAQSCLVGALHQASESECCCTYNDWRTLWNDFYTLIRGRQEGTSTLAWLNRRAPWPTQARRGPARRLPHKRPPSHDRLVLYTELAVEHPGHFASELTEVLIPVDAGKLVE